MKRCLPLITILCLAGALLAQPVNDDCSSATLIGSSNLDDGTMSGNCDPLTGQSYVDATPWEVAPGLFFVGNCWGGMIDSVVFYSFVAQGVSGMVEVIGGPGMIPQISVLDFNVTCDVTGAIEIGCAENGPIVFDNQLVVGQTYYVVVAFEGSVEGNFDICVFNPEPAPNDNCLGAIDLSNLDGCNNNLNNYYPSSENIVPGCFPAGITQSVWYSFVAQGVSIASLYATGGANAHIAVWDFDGVANCDLSAGVILACATNVTSLASAIVLDNLLTIGNTYYIEVVFANNATGDFNLCLDNPEPAFNDDCMNAEPYPTNLLNDSTTCQTSLNGNDLNNDWPSTDISNGFGCWNANSTYNVWFTFTAQGPDLDVTVDALSFADVEQIAVIEFTGSACDPVNWVIWGCITGAEIDIDNSLTIGNTYYVGVGFANNGVGDYCINIFNPEPPVNDLPCSAIMIDLNGTSPECVNNPQPTTTYANPELTANSFPAACQTIVENTVWYTIQMSDPNNVGFSIDLQSQGLIGDVSIVLYEDPDCNNGPFSIAFFHCGAPPADPLEWGPINENAVYYLMVGSSESGQGDFSLCVSEIPPCFTNNFCNDPAGLSSAEVMATPTTQAIDDCSGSGDPFVCVMGCNEFADPEPGTSGCIGPTDPVVWYTFDTDADANLLNVSVISPDMLAPTVSVFYSVPGICGSWFEVGCQSGSGGEVVINGIDVGGFQTYFIAVSGVNTFGGEFELCINTIAQITECVVNTQIEVVDRSIGTDLDGPFFPEEEVDICLRVINYDASTNNCQWLQGVVPIFGNGWDLSLFDPVLGATLNGQTFPRPNITGNGGVWNWWDDVTYHHDHCYYNVGDFNGDGWLDMCNGLFDQDCMGPGLAGGCCPSCWNSAPGAQLPPGWFTSGVTGLCGIDGHPTVDWGDGNSCGFMPQTWSFCFTLTVKAYPDCQDQDLSLGFVTFADGEVGSWQGTSSVCGADPPEFTLLPLCCNDITNRDDIHPPLCAGGVFNWTLDDPGASFFQWTANAPSSVTGHSSGSGPVGTVILDNLINTGSSPATVTYEILGFLGGDCPSVIWDIEVEIFPDIEVTMDPFTVCGTPSSPYTIIPEVEGGDPGSYSYQWHDMSTSPTFLVTAPSAGQQYTLTVTDAIGCSGTATVTLNVYTTFPVDIDASATEQCLVDGPIDLSADASGGIGSYTYTWEGPSGQVLSGSSISAHESGEWLVVAEDSDGCSGKDSIVIAFHESPSVSVFPEDVAVCPNNPSPEQILAITSDGEPPYTFEWETPNGFEITSFILVEFAGDYGITVTDANGCTAELQFEVFEQESPEPAIDPHDPYCPEVLMQGVLVEIPDDPDYVHYAWSNGGPQGPNATSIIVTQPGSYLVTITNIYGCRGTAEVEIEEHPGAVFDMPDTIPYCEGNFLFVDATIGWMGDEPNNPQYEWDGPGTSDGDPQQFLFTEGLYFLTVTDDNDCTASTEFYALPEDMISLEIIGDSVICNGVPALIMANSGFASYEWSNGSDDQMTTVFIGDMYYYVTVSDGDGCFGVDSVYVPASSPAPGIQGENVCEGDAATLDVGSWADVIWSTGETTSTITTGTSGTFTVTVTDQLGCTNTASYSVNVALKPVPDIQGVTSFCNGSSTTLNAGGVFDTYDWSTGQSTPEITVSSTTIVMVTVTNAAGCEAADTITVTATPLPTPAITGDTSICNNVAVQLDAGVGYAGYQWSIPYNTPTVDVNTPGTYFVTVTDALGCTAVDQIVVVASAPAPVISGITEVCQGGSEMLSATPGFAAYAWSSGGSDPTLIVNSSGTYGVTVTDQFGCQGTAEHSFTVHPNPTPAINGSSTFCPGSDTELDAGVYDGYQWSNGGNSQYNTVNTSGLISVTVTDINGCTGVASLDVQESNELTLNPQNQTICAGDIATLSVGVFDSYMWSTNATTETIDVTQAGTYNVTVTDGGCSGTASIVVTVNQTPSAIVTATAQACNDSANGSTINFGSLITGGDTGGTWVDIDNSGASGSFPALNFDGVAYGVYTFEYTTNSAVAPCVDVSYLVEVAIGTSPELIAAPDLCNDGDQLNLSTLVVPGGPAGGQWTILSAPPGSNSATIVGGMFDATNADPGTYTVQYEISGVPGSCPDSDTQVILVNPEPDAGFAASFAQICVGEDEIVTLDQLLQGADAGGVWIETSVNPSTGTAFNSVTGTFRTTTQVPGTYTFEYTLDGAAPCPDASTTVEVMIENVPQADAGADGSITCDITSVVLGGSGSSTGAEFDYVWTTANGVIVDPNVLNTAVTQAGAYTLTVINTVTGCESSDDVMVSLVGDIPSDLNMIVFSPACVGDPPGSAQVQAVIGGTAPYTYSLNGAPATTTANWTNLTAGDYTLLVTDNLGCKYERQFTIGTANDLAGELIGELLIESGDDAVLSYNLSIGTADSTVWFVNDVATCLKCDSLVFKPIGQTQVKLTIYDERGCELTLSTTIQVHVTRNVFVPNIFSPNGDGINDFFTVFASNTVVTNIEYLQVFTRWGDKVYERNNISPAIESLGWDGTFAGEQLMPGVYVFHAKVQYADGIEEIFKGDITLIR